ncbi:hypothetical protein PCANC_19179 [Puccinia coronata f. sp. avenae]|uniref:J domain-containing protein n=1 Tax=Puccinia coronata f. sp. avenae TaxID=200324 RepID=A0A2N5U2F6_9BASI|nr:hypothetical protein PCANC_19179 [Puccinia coronata f. sp. avenae]
MLSKALVLLNEVKEKYQRPVTHYEILGLLPSATRYEIQKAYKKAALEHHPDKNTGNTHQMTQLNVARDVLLNSIARCKYDEELKKMGSN